MDEEKNHKQIKKAIKTLDTIDCRGEKVEFGDIENAGYDDGNIDVDCMGDFMDMAEAPEL